MSKAMNLQRVANKREAAGRRDRAWQRKLVKFMGDAQIAALRAQLEMTPEERYPYTAQVWAN